MVTTSPHKFPDIGTLHVRPDPAWDVGIVEEVLKVYNLDAYRGRDPQLIVDVGAHIGSFSRLAHHRWHDARLLAVEPCADNYELTTRNLAEIPNSMVFHAAIGVSRDDRVDWEASAEDPNNTGGGGVVAHRDGTVRTVLLSDIIHLFGEIDVLKTDCEGGEWLWMADLLEEGLFDQVNLIVGEAHHPNWKYQVESYLRRTHEVTCEPVPNDDTKTLGYFTAVRKGALK